MAQSLRIGRAEEQVREARKRVEEQKARLHRMVVQGAPTQAAEDLLCKLNENLRRIARHAP